MPSLLFWLTLLLALHGAVLLFRIRSEARSEGFRASTTLLTWCWYVFCLALALFGGLRGPGRLELPILARSLGGLLFLSGAALLLWAAWWVHRHVHLSGRKVSLLVRDGPYRFTRNPQNLGWAFMLAGLALSFGSLYVLFLALAFCLGFRLYLVAEEAYLERLYGERWQSYKSEIPRFL